MILEGVAKKIKSARKFGAAVGRFFMRADVAISRCVATLMPGRGVGEMICCQQGVRLATRNWVQRLGACPHTLPPSIERGSSSIVDEKNIVFRRTVGRRVTLGECRQAAFDRSQHRRATQEPVRLC